MSLEFIDGFDHYSAGAQFIRKWDSTSTSNPVFPAGRFGGNAINVNNAILTSAQLASVATRVVGFAFQVLTASSVTIVDFRTSGSVQVDVRITSAGGISVTRNGTTLSSGTYVFALGTWYYIEFKATIHSSTGAYTLNINGATVLSGSGVNTSATGASATDGLQVHGSGTNIAFDDLYVLNTSGSTNNNFLGECRIMTSFPIGDDASFKQWTPSAGTTHFSLVDESSPNDDTDYVSSSTVGQIDLFTFPSISPTGSIAGVQTNIAARRDDAGPRQIAEQCRSSGANYTGGITHTMASNYLIYRQIREIDPATAAPWITSGLNAAEFGLKVIT